MLQCGNLKFVYCEVCGGIGVTLPDDRSLTKITLERFDGFLCIFTFCGKSPCYCAVADW